MDLDADGRRGRVAARTGISCPDRPIGEDRRGGPAAGRPNVHYLGTEGVRGAAASTSRADYLIVGRGLRRQRAGRAAGRGSGKRCCHRQAAAHRRQRLRPLRRRRVLVHKYGPHIFHTNSREVFEYLSRFTEWRPYQHRVLASVDGQLLPIPINLDTINRCTACQPDLLRARKFFASWPNRETRSAPRKTWSSARSAASCTRSSSATTPASSGASTPRSWTPR
jgi:hypothetical protein